MRFDRQGLGLLGICVIVIATGVGRSRGELWNDMDYGPFLTATIEVEEDNVVGKGLAFRLDDGPGGIAQGQAFVVYDTDTLTCSAGWLGAGFINWQNVAFDGSHGTHSSLIGQRVFTNPIGPGWADPRSGSWRDERIRGTDDRCYGPLVRQWAHWRGLYQAGPHNVLSYSVGDTDILESPSLMGAGARRLFVRTFQIGARDKELVLQVAATAGRSTSPERLLSTSSNPTSMIILRSPEAASADALQERSAVHFDGQAYFDVAQAEEFDVTTRDFSLAARVRTRNGGTLFSLAAPSGPWIPNGRTWFIRNGKLCFDIGWVGAVESHKTVADGEWHDVGLNFEAASARIQLVIDGEVDGEGTLKAPAPAAGSRVRIGYTSSNFPGPPVAFEGELEYVRFDARCRSLAEMSAGRDGSTDSATAQWDFAHLVADRVRGGIDDRFSAIRKSLRDLQPASTGLALACLGSDLPQWDLSNAQSVRLVIPAGSQPIRFQLLYAPLAAGENSAALRAELAAVPATRDLAPLTLGGPPLWPDRLPTQAAPLGAADGPFVVEDLTLPNANPWRSWLRCTAFDFFADGDRAAICTWQGDVWLVQGLRDPTGHLQWQRIASGLFQPLGLRIVAEQIYVLGRDQITRLHDLNGDNETDYYENFNNDAQVTEHFHEFAMDLQTDAQGEFYYMKAARHALPAVVPQHGTLIHVTRDGQSSEILAGGFRAPDGLLVNGDGTYFSSDQEGHWTPMNRINLIRPGGFYGNMMAANPTARAEEATDQPVCWIHREIDRSPTAQLWVREPSWGPLQNALLSLSYGTGKTYRVLLQQAEGILQGGIVQLPVPELPTGIQRGRFHPDDQRLYVCGMFGWSSDKTLSGGFYRIRYTGQPIRTPEAIEAYREGILLRFSEPLDGTSAADWRNYACSRWNYQRTANYGSNDYRVSDGKPGRDLVPVAGVSVSDDQQTVFLHIPEMRTCMQMRVRYQLSSSDGAAVAGLVDHTIHVLPAVTDSVRGRFTDALATPSQVVHNDAASRFRRGLVLQFTSANNSTPTGDARVARLVALHTEPGERPSPFFTSAAPFQAVWSGVLLMDLPEQVTLQAELLGELVVTLNGQPVLQETSSTQQRTATVSVPLQAGANALEVRLRSADDGAAHLRLDWTRPGLVTESLAPDRLWHDPLAVPALNDSLLLRSGRELLATRHCWRCHALPEALSKAGGLPELQMDTPNLADAGLRFDEAWLRQWIANPQVLRNHVTMPRVSANCSPQEIADIAAYVVSLQAGSAANSAATASNDEEADEAKIEAGLALYEDLGCIACHHFELPDHPDPYGRTSLRFARAKYLPGALEGYLRAPHADYAWRRMPDFQLTADEASSLAAYVRSRSQLLPAGPGIPGDSQRGATAFEQRGCLACHAVDKNGQTAPRTQRPLFELTSLSTGCLAADTVRRVSAPEYVWTEVERVALEAILQTDGASLACDAPAEAAQRAVVRLQCANCHRLDGDTPAWPAVLGDEGEQGHPPESLPPLTWTGEKLQTDWMRKVFSGELPSRTRPWKKSHMPAFPVYADILSRGLAAQHGLTTTVGPRQPIDPTRIPVGKLLTEKERGFHCLQCHGLAGQPPEAPFESRGIDFPMIRSRLRPEFFQRWIGNPIQFDPSVPMPRFSPDGHTTPVTSILDGQAGPQFDAIWQYLQSLGEEPK